MNRFARRRLPLVAAGLTLALAGCLGGTDPTPDATVVPTEDPVVSEAPSATAEPTATPTPEPTETPSATPASSFDAGGELTVAPNAEADALFLERDECTNRQDGYIVEFPEDWYTNTELARFPACSWFSPTFYEVDDQTQVPDEIAIEIFWLDGARGYLGEPISREEVRVGGQIAARIEITGTSESQTDGTMYEYVIRLGPTPEEGPNLVARTDTDMGGDYDLNKAVLDRIMATIEFIGTTQ